MDAQVAEEEARMFGIKKFFFSFSISIRVGGKKDCKLAIPRTVLQWEGDILIQSFWHGETMRKIHKSTQVKKNERKDPPRKWKRKKEMWQWQKSTLISSQSKVRERERSAPPPKKEGIPKPTSENRGQSWKSREKPFLLLLYYYSGKGTSQLISLPSLSLSLIPSLLLLWEPYIILMADCEWAPFPAERRKRRRRIQHLSSKQKEKDVEILISFLSSWRAFLRIPLPLLRVTYSGWNNGNPSPRANSSKWFYQPLLLLSAKKREEEEDAFLSHKSRKRKDVRGSPIFQKCHLLLCTYRSATPFSPSHQTASAKQTASSPHLGALWKDIIPSFLSTALFPPPLATTTSCQPRNEPSSMSLFPL